MMYSFTLQLKLKLNKNVVLFRMQFLTGQIIGNLKLNIAKCEALAITNKWKPISFNYFINGQSLSCSNSVKYLGLLVDHKLSWSKHC